MNADGKFHWNVKMYLYNGKTVEYNTKALSNDYAQYKAFKHFGLTWNEVRSVTISPIY
jgi:hypothetical protein